MRTVIDIPLDKAELLSTLLEGLLYGFSLLMFGATIWTLLSQRFTRRINYKMLTVACLLLLFSTVHIVIDIIRVMQGLILFRDTYPGGPVAYFSDPSQWTFTSKHYVYTAQTLIGDGVVLYRCYAVWRSKLVMILPVLLWCAVGVTGIAGPYASSNTTQWITSFYASTLMTNFSSTLLLAYRIWLVDRETARLFRHQTSRVRPMLYVIVDAGMIYSLVLFVALICFASQSNGQCILLDIIVPIISITFYMVIIRIGLVNGTAQTIKIQSGNIPTNNKLSSERTRTVQDPILIITHDQGDGDQHELMSPTSAISDNDGVGPSVEEAV